MRQGNAYTKKTAIKKSQKDEGFTLIEVLIAISILAVGLLAVATMQITSIKVNSTAGQITDRITLAQDKLEELMALPYSSPWLEDLGDPPSGTDTNGNTHQETTDGYTISWTVTNNALVSNTKLITVTVTGRGKTTRVSYIKPSI
jgi:prepilin-type N-terminal cleavage/methylation domain-containing protein